MLAFSFINAFAGEPGLYTDQDLEKYKAPGSTYVPEQEHQKTSDILHEINETKETLKKEWWCEKGSYYGERVDTAKKNYQEAEKKLDDAKSDAFWKKTGASRIKSHENKLARAKRQLEDAEKKLMDFEQKAHRKGIPPGWLRCQFM